MNNILRLWSLVLCTILIIALSGGVVYADDTEIYIGGNLGAGTVQPNVVFIIDTSGSMGTADVPVTTTPYDPTQTYSGSCSSSYIYWSTNGIPPNSCSTSHYFDASQFTCSASSTAFGNVAGDAGYYTDVISRYSTAKTNNTWTILSRKVHTGLVTCQSDYVNNTTGPWPADENNGGPWTTNSSNQVTWSSAGGSAILYSANYMNWYTTTSGGTTYETRMKAVQDGFSALMNSTSGINAALMRYSTTSNDGGYFVAPMLSLTSTNRTTLINAVNGFSPNGQTPLAETLYEASLFYRGQPVYYGNSSTPGTNVSGVLDPNNTNNYKSPIQYQCQKNFVVLLTDGEPNNDNGADTLIEGLPGFKQTTGSSTCSGGNCLDELAQWMYYTDLINPGLNDKQNVITYTIGLNLNVPLLVDTANKGGGKFYTITSATDLSNAFNSILTQILAINSTFIAPAVTVNAFNRLTHRDDLFFSVFKPKGAPDWRGNIKHYKLSGNPPIVVDANGNSAVDANTGFFSATSTSIWTLPTDAPDGDDVAKGGAAGLLTTSRNLYTYTGSTPPNNENLIANTADAFNENNTSLTTSLLGLPATTSATDLANLIKWSRGVDVLDSNENGDTTDARRQIGDILHSMPVLVTYGGTDTSPDITMFVGDNEGFLHAINAVDGSEQFGFIPKELLPNLNLLYTTSPAAAHPYGMDGPLTAWHNDANNDHLVLNPDNTVQTGEFVYLYAGMRRGGDNYYAFDFTDRSKPILKWQITGGSGDFAELGQTWSRPIHTQIKLNGIVKDVLIFGGGYDTAEDTASTPQADSIGRAIYMVDATTGQRLWWASSDKTADLVLPKMTNSIPSDVTVVDINNDGIADYLYVGDMGGRVWRIDFKMTNAGPASLATGGLLAELGGTDTANNRHFYYAPDVALTHNSNGYLLTVAMGTGYRAHPLNQTIQDRFYVINDENVLAPPKDTNNDGIPDYQDFTEASLYDATANDLGQATGATLDAARTALGSAHGWYIRLVAADGSYQGEKVLASSVTLQGQIFFTTFTPVVTAQSTSCAPSQGTAKTYVVNLADATPAYDLVADGTLQVEDRSTTLVRGGIPPSPSIIFPPSGGLVAMVGPVKLPIALKLKLIKSYWKQKK